HFGFSISPDRQFSTLFRTIRVDYEANTPPGSSLRIDVRASADGANWTAWEIGLSSGASASFGAPARYAQYRATLLGNARPGPALRSVSLVPQQEPALYSAMDLAEQPVAPTYRI